MGKLVLSLFLQSSLLKIEFKNQYHRNHYLWTQNFFILSGSKTKREHIKSIQNTSQWKYGGWGACHWLVLWQVKSWPEGVYVILVLISVDALWPHYAYSIFKQSASWNLKLCGDSVCGQLLSCPVSCHSSLHSVIKNS